MRITYLYILRRQHLCIGYIHKVLEPYIGAVNISKYYTIELVYIYFIVPHTGIAILLYKGNCSVYMSVIPITYQNSFYLVYSLYKVPALYVYN
jgi:hypothetical protein